MIAALLAAILVCGDARDVPVPLDDPGAGACPESRWGKLCGCGGTIQWAPGVGGGAVDHYLIERQFLDVWSEVGTTSRLWWKTSEDRPLGFEGFKYVYRIWAVGPTGLRSPAPSNPIYLIGNPHVCVDDVTWKKVSCWAPGGPGAP